MTMKIRKMEATTQEARLVRPDGGRGRFGLGATWGGAAPAAAACGGGGIARVEVCVVERSRKRIWKWMCSHNLRMRQNQTHMV